MSILKMWYSIPTLEFVIANDVDQFDDKIDGSSTLKGIYVPRQQQCTNDNYYSALGITLLARAEEYDSVWDID